MPSTAMTAVSGIGSLGGASSGGPDFWSTILAVRTMVAVSVCVLVRLRALPVVKRPPNAGGTTTLTAARGMTMVGNC